MAQKRGKGCLVGVEVGGGVGAHHVEQLAVGVLLARVGAGVGLDPLRNVVVLPVLPCAEPEQDDAEVVLARLRDQQVHVGEVECAFGGLHLLPVDGGLDGIGVHGLGCAPHTGKGRGPCAGVADLAPEDEERLAVDDEGEAAVPLLQAGKVAGLGRGDGSEEHGKDKSQNRCY